MAAASFLDLVIGRTLKRKADDWSKQHGILPENDIILRDEKKSALAEIIRHPVKDGL